jgi:hypothetical protein
VRLAALLILLLRGAAVHAAGSALVVLDVGPSDSRATRWPEAEQRARAELESVGLDVADIVADPSQASSLETLHSAARLHHALAAVRIARVESPARAELWIVDQVTGKASFRQVSIEGLHPAQAVAVVALSVVELLNASLLELRTEHTGRGTEAPPPEVYRLVDRGLGDVFAPYRFSLRAGPTVIGSPGGLELTAGPALAAGVGLSARWAIEGEAAAGVTRSTLVGAAGTEQVGVGVGRLLLVLRSASGKRIQTQVGVGAGALVVWASGVANDHYTAHRESTVVALPSATAAVALCLTRSTRVRLGVGAGFAIPALSFDLAGVPTATAGRPMLDGSVAFEWVWPGAQQ